MPLQRDQCFQCRRLTPRILPDLMIMIPLRGQERGAYRATKCGQWICHYSPSAVAGRFFPLRALYELPKVREAVNGASLLRRCVSLNA